MLLIFGVINGVIKLKWLQSFVKEEQSLWLSIAFQRVGRISFLLKCDFDLLKLPFK